MCVYARVHMYVIAWVFSEIFFEIMKLVVIFLTMFYNKQSLNFDKV